MSKRTQKLHLISRRLTTHQLRRLQETEVAMSYDDLFGTEVTQRGSSYFLGYYSREGIKYALEKFGLFKELKKRGFDNFQLTVSTRDPYKQRVAIYYEKKDPEHLLGELVVKRKHVTVYPPFPTLIQGRNFEMIAVEWLCMQNPRGKFSEKRPRLPGQKYPGLGLGDMVMEILILMCGRLRTAGLLNVPEHFHNAQMYSPQFRYLDPLYEAKRRAIARDLMPRYPLAVISWAIDLKCVTENGKPFEWFIADQVIPLDRDLKEYFQSKNYIQYVNHTAQQYRYELDEAKWQEKQSQIENFVTC